MLGRAFKAEYLDFGKGIRVGHLEPRARITQILKLSLQELYGQDFIIDRWGRGVYWQWICFVPRANRRAKPLSGGRSYSSAKFFVMVDREEGLFKSGLHVERGLIQPPDSQEAYRLRPDWDWHRLAQGLEPNGWWEREVRRLIEEGRVPTDAGVVQNRSPILLRPSASGIGPSRNHCERAAGQVVCIPVALSHDAGRGRGLGGTRPGGRHAGRLPGTDAGDEPLSGGCCRVAGRARYLTSRVLGNWARQPNQKARCAARRMSFSPFGPTRAVSVASHCRPELSRTLEFRSHLVNLMPVAS